MSQISYLDPASQGSTLSEKAVDVHVVDGCEYVARWYHSPFEADLMIWLSSTGCLARFQLNSSGQIVDWNSLDGIQTGLIVELESESRGDIAETIKFDMAHDRGTIAVARSILVNAVNLPDSVREIMLANLDDLRTELTRIRQSGARTRFWGRFKRWTIGA